jgi:hypothetical protein
VTRDVGLTLLSAWLSCWAAEERALAAAARNHDLPPAEIREHLAAIARERDGLRPLLS